MKMSLSAAMFLFAVMAAPVRAQDAPAAGLVVTVTGPVSVRRAGEPMPVRPGFALQPGDSLVIKRTGACEGFSPVGEPFERSGPALIVFARETKDNFRSRVSRWVARQLAQWVGQSRSQPLITRSGDELDAPAPALRTFLPANKARVRPGDVRLRWQSVEGVDKFTLIVAAEDGTETSSTVSGSEHVVEGLQPGRTYAWLLRLASNDGQLGSRWNEFTVMTKEEESNLDASLAGLSDVMAGVVLLSAGVHDEALRRLNAGSGGQRHTADVRLWRARALAEAGMHERAYIELMHAMEEY